MAKEICIEIRFASLTEEQIYGTNIMNYNIQVPLFLFADIKIIGLDVQKIVDINDSNLRKADTHTAICKAIRDGAQQPLNTSTFILNNRGIHLNAQRVEIDQAARIIKVFLRVDAGYYWQGLSDGGHTYSVLYGIKDILKSMQIDGESRQAVRFVIKTGLTEDQAIQASSCTQNQHSVNHLSRLNKEGCLDWVKAIMGSRANLAKWHQNSEATYDPSPYFAALKILYITRNSLRVASGGSNVSCTASLAPFVAKAKDRMADLAHDIFILVDTIQTFEAKTSTSKNHKYAELYEPYHPETLVGQIKTYGHILNFNLVKIALCLLRYFIVLKSDSKYQWDRDFGEILKIVNLMMPVILKGVRSKSSTCDISRTLLRSAEFWTSVANDTAEVLHENHIEGEFVRLFRKSQNIAPTVRASSKTKTSKRKAA